MRNEQGGIAKVAIVAIAVIVIVVVAVVVVLQMKPTAEEPASTPTAEPTSTPTEEVPPKPGEWTASTGNSKFTFAFTVNPDSTGITIVDYTFTEFTCGSVTTSGGASVEGSLPWPITDGQFTIEWSEYTSDWNVVIEGSFDETGTHASGTWEISAGEDRQTGTWEASAP